jgi:hypothetical protein
MTPSAFNPEADGAIDSGPGKFRRIGTLRTAITLLLATVPWSVSAQTVENDKLQQIVSNLRACVRANAPTAHAAGVLATSDAVDFFIKMCGTTLNDLTNVGAVPPGLFRVAIRNEWNAFIEETRPR